MPSHRSKNTTSLIYSRIVSILSIMLTLTTLGIIALGFVVGQSLKENIKERLSFRLELPNNLNPEELKNIISQVENKPFVRATNLLTADSAARELSNGREEDNPIRVLGYNPLPHILTLYLKPDYAHPDSLQQVQKELNQMDLSANLSYAPELVDSVQTNTHKASLFLWIFLAFQALVTYIQLASTIRLRIYADRLRIRTLTLVGGSPSFIRRPFVLQALADALIGSILATCLIGVGIYTLQSVWQISLFAIVPTSSLIYLFSGISLLGMLLSALIARSTAGRYLRMKGSKIHLI